MPCHNCQSLCKRFGKHRNGLQRFRCLQCKKTLTEDHVTPESQMRLAPERAVAVLKLLLEGMSVRSVERVTGVHRDTILRLLVRAGERCQRLMEEKIQDLPVFDVQVDEIWGFVFKKESHKLERERQIEVMGDAYCFVGIESNCKLVVCWHLGKRDQLSTDLFIRKLSKATSRDRYQLSSDGFRCYGKSVPRMLRDRVDFGQLVKVYGVSRDGEQRYSPPEVLHSIPTPIMGNPAKERICTSHVERQNLSIRMGMRRMTRLTNAFSKKWANLEAAYSLWFAYYNWCRRHQTLRATPAMEAGLTDRVWSVQELLNA